MIDLLYFTKPHLPPKGRTEGASHCLHDKAGFWNRIYPPSYPIPRPPRYQQDFNQFPQDRAYQTHLFFPTLTRLLGRAVRRCQDRWLLLSSLYSTAPLILTTVLDSNHLLICCGLQSVRPKNFLANYLRAVLRPV